MASGVDRGASGASPVDDDIDAGWDDVPESVSLPRKGASFAPAPVSIIRMWDAPSNSGSPLANAPPKPARARPPALASDPPRATASALAPAGFPPNTTEPRRAASLPPVLTVPRPHSSSGVPPAVAASARPLPRIDGRDDPILSVESPPTERDEPTLEVSAASSSEASDAVAADANEAAVANASEPPAQEGGATIESTEREETPSPSDIEVPDFRRRPIGRAKVAGFVGSIAALVVATIAWSHFANVNGQPTASAVAGTPERRAPEQAPPPPRPPTVSSPPAPAANEGVTTPAAPVEKQVAGSLAETSRTVAVKTVPGGAVIFRAGKRLGTGSVQVTVERNVKQRLTALLDGYTPSNFVLDGSRDSVTIVLKRAPKPRVPTVREGDTAEEPARIEEAAATTPAPASASAPAAPAEAAPAATTTVPEGTAPPAVAPSASDESPE